MISLAWDKTIKFYYALRQGCLFQTSALKDTI